MIGLTHFELELDKVTPEQLADLNSLLTQVWSSAEPMTMDYTTRMHTAGTRMFVCTCDDHIVATVLLAQTVIMAGRKDWIEDVVTDEAHRGRGISTRLMNMAELASRDSGAESINLTSNPARVAARRMYVNRGYELRDTGVFRKTF